MSSLGARVTELLAKPSLEGLAYALEHPEVWPEEYARAGWHWGDCGTCAMGLAKAMWGLHANTVSVGNALGIDRNTAFYFFFTAFWDEHDARPPYPRPPYPRDIAERIRAYLATH